MVPDLPRFTVIVPTFNRLAQLAQCLHSLSRLDYPRDRLEVIVVNDGGESPAGVIAVSSGGLNVTLIGQTNTGPAAARNLGIARASGDYCVFTDDDCVVSEGWLHKLALRCREMPGRAVGGSTVNALTGNRYASASQHLSGFVYSFYNREPNRACFFASNNLTFPAEALRRCGGFDRSMRTSEDRELCDRWLAQGRGMAYATEAVVFHAHQLTFRGFCRQHFGYGRGAFHFYQARRRRGAAGMKLRPFHFYAGLAVRTLKDGSGSGRASLAPLIFLSQAASAAGFFWEAAGRGFGRLRRPEPRS